MNWKDKPFNVYRKYFVFLALSYLFTFWT